MTYDILLRIVAALVSSCFFFVGTFKLLGVAQQSGYRGGAFFRWMGKRGNVYGVRLVCWALLNVCSAAITLLCFSFLGTDGALCLSAVPFLGFALFFCYVDKKYALKVPVKATGRVKRLAVLYFFLTACLSYVVIALLAFAGDWVYGVYGATLYEYLQYLPFALFPVLLPLLLWLANALISPFERLRNRRYVGRAKKMLEEKEILRVAVVGSYGKTSVKNILATLLAEKYSVVKTPASYNTPMGIAKTVLADGFGDKQVFIAEMGARRQGDIRELCELVNPDYALFTGVCAQHIETFGSLEKVIETKCEIFQSGAKKIVCAAGLQEQVSAQVNALTDTEKGACVFLTGDEIADLSLSFDRTQFLLRSGGQEIPVSVPLLGKHSAENVALCVALALEMGLTKKEIVSGLEKVEQIEHRLKLTQENGVYILDDAYNANEKGAAEAIDALSRFEGRKTVVTPGLVETGVLNERLGKALGEKLAQANLDRVILVGDTLIAPVKKGYLAAGGDEDKLCVCLGLEQAKQILAEDLRAGDAVLFLNDLPDVY